MARLSLQESMGLEPDFTELRDSTIERSTAVGALIMDQALEGGLVLPLISQIVAHCVVRVVERVASNCLLQENEFELEEVVERSQINCQAVNVTANITGLQ